MKKCNECGKLLHDRQKRWCSHICEVTHWQKSNKEKANRYKQNYLLNHPEQRKQSVKKYDTSERGKKVKSIWKEKNRKRLQALWRMYSKRYRDRNVAQTQKRRAIIRGLKEHHTKEEWQELKRKYDFKCLVCDKKEPEILLTPDHIIPLIKGGKNTIDNIQPLCRNCNYRKNDKHSTDYRKLV